MIDRAIGLFGLALCLIVGLYAFAPEGWPKMPSWITIIGIGLGILLFGVGIGLVVADYRSPVEPQKPDLHLAMSGGNVFIPDKMPGITGIGLDARVWNTGAPSVVIDWKFRIIPNGKEAVLAQLTKMPNVLTASGPFSSAKLLSQIPSKKRLTIKLVLCQSMGCFYFM
jgi:hypothetical protein